MSGKLKKFLLILIICLALVIIGYIGTKYLMIADIIVEGNEFYSDEEIAELAAVPVNTHVFNADFDEIKSNIESDPYIVVNDISFEFPNTLKIDVSEEQPVAFFSFGGQDVVVSENLKVLSVGEFVPQNITTEIVGLDALPFEAGQVVESENSYKQQAVISILEQIRLNCMEESVRKIDITDVNSIKLSTDDGHTVLFGEGDEYESKFNWVKTMIAMLKNDGILDCTIDVSSGDFATIQK